MTDGFAGNGGMTSVHRPCTGCAPVWCRYAAPISAVLTRLIAAFAFLVVSVPSDAGTDFSDVASANKADEILSALSSVCIAPLVKADLPNVLELSVTQLPEKMKLDDSGVEVLATSYELKPFSHFVTQVNEEEVVGCAAAMDANLQVARIFVEKLEEMWPLKTSTEFTTPPTKAETENWLGVYSGSVIDSQTEKVGIRMVFNGSFDPGFLMLTIVRLPEGSQLFGQDGDNG